MAGDWIKVEHTLPDKPEIVSMAALLNIDQDAVAGKLLRVWVWADQNSIDGNAVGVTKAFLDRLTICHGFADAMLSVGWLAVDGNTLTLPNFNRHNGQTAKGRSVTNRRVAEHRAKGDGECNAGTVTDPLQKPLPEKRREDTVREKSAAAPVSIEEVKSVASLHPQLPKPDDSFCEWFWDEGEKRGWTDPQTGLAWRDWKAAFRAAWRGALHNKRERDSRRQPPTPSTPPKPTRAQL